MAIPPPPQDAQGAPEPSPYGQSPYGQVPPAPYGSGWQQPYPYGGPPPAQSPVNGWAIASLVVGILCCLPLLGLIFGIVALVQIKKSGDRGKGMAVAGLTLSSVGSLLLALFFFSGAASDFMDGVRDGLREARENQVTALDKGECFNVPGGDMEGDMTDVDVVPCAERHHGEVFGSFDLADRDGYPGEDRITEVAQDKCSKLVDDYVGDRGAASSGAYLYFFGPTDSSWSDGDREVTCVLGQADGSKTSGSLRDTAPGSGDDGSEDSGEGGQGSEV
ncbi:DUF4190 domain-containing protein [Streptomyces sp. NBC_01304]|uniref:DUF4190 domain-containing protein n=1 Tax=Streptomyces sp. NBC_01304 TaxID=2903818 RepID=UPI002E1547B9|nr:DUF4190 domain-containing protein [Streptomyces sp. NBC_01304]